MPMMVMARMALRSNASDASLVSCEKSESARWIHPISPRSRPPITIRSRRYSNQTSSSRTAMRYQAYTNPNMAIAEVTFGVSRIS